MDKVTTKKELLNKLRAYSATPDDDIIRIKTQIKETLLLCPELLYALNEKGLEKELFRDDGSVNWEYDEASGKYEVLGEWDRYFGATSNIRPFLFFPQTQTDVKHYVCYQVDSDDALKGNDFEKILIVTFNIFVHGDDPIDKLTGLPRHDLISSIIREKFSWIGLEVFSTMPTRNRESITDNNYLTRTIKYECIVPNDLTVSPNGVPRYKNKRW